MMNFKTNAKCEGCVAAIGEKLNKVIKADEWHIDLNTPEKLLKVTANIPAETIMALVADAGFKAQQLL